MSVALPILDSQQQRPNFAQGPGSLDAVRLLRLSITDRCNLRCVYCMPEDGVEFAARRDLLSIGDIRAVAAAARSVGVDHFKVTGGEPTVRADLIEIIQTLAEFEPTELSMTTNGLLLGKLAPGLRRAGLDRLTLSCDSLRPELYARISGNRGKLNLDMFWRGVDAAVAAGFERLKINVVVLGGINDQEITDFAALSIKHPWTIRFIEYMPLGESQLLNDGLNMANAYTVDTQQIIERIEAELGKLTPVIRSNDPGTSGEPGEPGEPGVGPAQVFRLPGSLGRVGFISAMSKPFCQTCNRLRLTANGELRACLFDDGEVPLLPFLRSVKPGDDPDPQHIVELMRACVAMKPQSHGIRGTRAMSQLGG